MTQIEVKHGYLVINNPEDKTNKTVCIPLVPKPAYCSIDGQILQDGSVVTPPTNAPKRCLIASNGTLFTLNIDIEELHKIFETL